MITQKLRSASLLTRSFNPFTSLLTRSFNPFTYGFSSTLFSLQKSRLHFGGRIAFCSPLGRRRGDTTDVGGHDLLKCKIASSIPPPPQKSTMSTGYDTNSYVSTGLSKAISVLSICGSFHRKSLCFICRQAGPSGNACGLYSRSVQLQSRYDTDSPQLLQENPGRAEYQAMTASFHILSSSLPSNRSATQYRLSY
jgi:hypothetical protein